MDLGLLNYVNADLKWNIVKKGRRSVTRCPRKPGANSFEAKKEEKIVDGPIKKRKLLRESLSPEPQTPSGCRSDSRKKKQKDNIIFKKADDFSGLELLASTACSILDADKLPEVNLCSVDRKEAMVPDEKSIEKVTPLKTLRLHWDLNTVMDDWEEPHFNKDGGYDNGVDLNLEACEDDKSIKMEPESHQMMENLSIEDKISNSILDEENCGSKSESLTDSVKCEDFSSTSPTSVLREETILKGKNGNKVVGSEDGVSECCGSDDKKVDYDSPFEDGELRDEKKQTDFENSLSEKTAVSVKERPQEVSPRKTESRRVRGKSLSNTYVPQSRLSNFEDSYSRSWRYLGPEKSVGRWYGGSRSLESKNYNNINNYNYNHNYYYYNNNNNPRGDYRRNNNGGYYYYGNNREIRNDSYKQGGLRHEAKPSYLERKTPYFSTNSNRSRCSRSGSPIAWHFQKPKTSLEVQKPSIEIEPGFIERQSENALIRRNQKFERLKLDEDFRKDKDGGGCFKEGGGDGGCRR